MMSELTCPGSTMALGQIRWDRDRSPAYLRGESVELLTRPITRRSVDRGHQGHCLLPGYQVLKSAFPSRTIPAVHQFSVSPSVSHDHAPFPLPLLPLSEATPPHPPFVMTRFP